MAPLRVGGLTRWTSIDFPGRLAAVVFCQGCPWRCGYCHNPGLLDAARPGALDWPAVLDFLRRRRGLLDGVAFSGGEPLAQAPLPQALAQVRALGFATALHTGGMYPQRLAAALPLLDWVGLDIKALPRHYDAITRTPGSGARAWQSLQRLLDGATAFECRTTWHPALFDATALRALATRLADQGVRHWALQRCTLPGLPPWRGDAQAVLQGVQERFARFEVRGD